MPIPKSGIRYPVIHGIGVLLQVLTDGLGKLLFIQFINHIRRNPFDHGLFFLCRSRSPPQGRSSPQKNLLFEKPRAGALPPGPGGFAAFLIQLLSGILTYPHVIFHRFFFMGCLAADAYGLLFVLARREDHMLQPS